MDPDREQTATSTATSTAGTPPALDLVAAPDHFRLPAGLNFGSASGVAINSRGHIFVFHRGPQPLMQFDADGLTVITLSATSTPRTGSCAS